MSGGSGFRNQVMHCQNVDFTGNFPVTSQMVADGQLLIGASSAPYIRANTLTAGTGITITNAAGAITIANSGASDLHTAQFIVNSSGTSGTGANFTTITAAIAAAQGTGVKQTIFIMPGNTGIYTENFTLPANISLSAFQDGWAPNVTIVGKITCTDAGVRTISGLRLQTNADNFLAITGIAATVVNIIGCYINCSDNTGITFSSSSGDSQLTLSNCRGTLGLNSVSYWAYSAQGLLIIDKCDFFFGSATTVASTCTNGVAYISFCRFNFPLSSSNIGRYIINNLSQETALQNTTCLTLAGTGSSQAMFSFFSSAASTTLSIGAGSTLDLNSCNISSQDANTIAGAGTVKFGAVDFIAGSSAVIVTTTQTPSTRTNDAVKVVSPGAYPYTTTPQDAVILVDTSAARTITPLANPITGQLHRIKDSVGTAGANIITVTPSGKNIDGAASAIINTNYGSIDIVYNGTEWSIC